MQGRRLPCHGAEDVSLGLVQQTTEIHQLQFIDQVFDVLVVQFQQIRAKLWETVEIPQLQLVFSWTRCCSPVACNKRCLWSAVQCSSSTVENVPVIMRDSGNAPDSGHREFLGHSSLQQRQLSEAFCVIFRAPPAVSARGLQGCRSRQEFHSQVTRHRGCTIRLRHSDYTLDVECSGCMTVVMWIYTHS